MRVAENYQDRSSENVRPAIVNTRRLEVRGENTYISLLKPPRGTPVTYGPPDVVVACEPLHELVARRKAAQTQLVLADRSLHRSPGRLREHLQDIVDRNRGRRVVFTLGLCGKATVGLAVSAGEMVFPQVDDCLALLMGSGETYREECRRCPGTYYLSQGWLDSADDLVSEFERSLGRYGPARTARLFDTLLRHYRRVAYIRVGRPQEETDHVSRALEFARRFGLKFSVLQARLSLLDDLLHGRPRPDVLHIPAGGRTRVTDFLPYIEDPPAAGRAAQVPASRVRRGAGS